MKVTILKTFLISLLAIAASNASAAKLYKWVDANGNVSYQDQPPPKSAKILSEKEVVSSADKDQKNDIKLPDVVAYTANNCQLCDLLVSVLRKNKVPHIELPIEDDREAQAKILEKASSVIAPTIFIGEDMIQAGNENQLREKLRSAGFKIESDDNAESNNETDSE